MRFDWDTRKAESNYAKHGIEFDYATRVFDDADRITSPDNRKDYGEIRENTIGDAGGVVILAVTHTDRAGVCRLISARHANKKERKKYHEQNS